MEYKVIVVGSGIGGLCAAARLAYDGFKTIVLEKFPILGGRYTYANYKGYNIPTAALLIVWGKEDPVYRTLQEVKAPEIEVYPVIAPPRYRIGGKDYDLPERGGLRTLISIASRDKSEEERIMEVLRRALRWQEPSDTLSFKDWLLQYTNNPRIYNIFQAQITAWFGVNAYEIPAGEFFRNLKRYAQAPEMLFPKNGLRDVVDALASVIRNKGGEILTRTRVQEIVIEEGKAKGVIAETGKGKQKFEGEIVISNVGPKKTIELAKEENFDRSYLKEVRDRIRPAVIISYFITSDKPLLDYPGLFSTPDARRTEGWVPLSLICPQWAPKGKYLLVSYAVPPSTLLYDRKTELEVFLLDLKEQFPQFEEFGGELLMVRNYCGDWPVTHSWPGYNIMQRTPIENLYNVGDGVCPSGYSVGAGAAESARVVVEDIKARVKR